MAQERVRHQPKQNTTRTDTADTDTEAALAEARQGGADLDHVDDWLDEIDAVLEETDAAEFVRAYVQKGGE